MKPSRSQGLEAIIAAVLLPLAKTVSDPPLPWREVTVLGKLKDLS